ncbi:unnamed protein product [Ceutorhynchus assimilis]|uniref:Uncharacterized protein n=1 Tax=Ceutorhynchus assimilis TaxID=467358 RepID=A0A9N9QL66_9CUCU|nr:unnamed protein product [Ceutorhynchus assimilis]
MNSFSMPEDYPYHTYIRINDNLIIRCKIKTKGEVDVKEGRKAVVKEIRKGALRFIRSDNASKEILYLEQESLQNKKNLFF